MRTDPDHRPEAAGPCLIAIAGPSCSGKTTLALRLAAALREAGASLLCLDAYYRDLSHLPPDDRARQNFDAPDALDWPLLREHVACLARGQAVAAPVYDFVTHTRTSRTERVEALPYIIVEGLLALHDPVLRDLCRLKVFVQLQDGLCLERRMVRDVEARGRTPDSVSAQFAATVRPMAEQYILPTAAFADLVLHGDAPVEASLEALERALVECGGLQRTSAAGSASIREARGRR